MYNKSLLNLFLYNNRAHIQQAIFRLHNNLWSKNKTPKIIILLDSFSFQLYTNLTDLTINPQTLLELLLLHGLEINDKYLLFAWFQSPQRIQNTEPTINYPVTLPTTATCQTSIPLLGCCYWKPPVVGSAVVQLRFLRSLLFV